MEMPQSIKHTAQVVSTRITLHSATLRLVKVESGIKGLLPTSWAPPIYSVSLLTKLRCALAGNGLLRLADVRSFLARICQMQKPTKMMKKSEKTRQGLYNVGFIGIENNAPLRTTSRENGPTLFENSPRTSGLAQINANNLRTS
jgi:hypothetical protein